MDSYLTAHKNSRVRTQVRFELVQSVPTICHQTCIPSLNGGPFWTFFLRIMGIFLRQNPCPSDRLPSYDWQFSPCLGDHGQTCPSQVFSLFMTAIATSCASSCNILPAQNVHNKPFHVQARHATPDQGNREGIERISATAFKIKLVVICVDCVTRTSLISTTESTVNIASQHALETRKFRKVSIIRIAGPWLPQLNVCQSGWPAIYVRWRSWGSCAC